MTVFTGRSIASYLSPVTFTYSLRGGTQHSDPLSIWNGTGTPLPPRFSVIIARRLFPTLNTDNVPTLYHCHKQQPVLASRTYAAYTYSGSGSSYHTYDIPCRRPDTVLVHARISKICIQWLDSFVCSHSHVIDRVRRVPCVLDPVRCLLSQHRLPARLT